MREPRIRIQLEGLTKLVDRGAILMRKIEASTMSHPGFGRKRIELNRSCALFDAFFRPSHGDQIPTLVLMSVSIVGFKLDGACEFCLGTAPIIVIPEVDDCQISVGFSERII